MVAVVDVGTIIPIALGAVAGAVGSIWFILRQAGQATRDRIEPDKRRRITQALRRGRSVSEPADAELAVKVATAWQAGLRAAIPIVIGYLMFTLVAFVVAVALGDPAFTVLSAVILIAAISAVPVLVTMRRRVASSEVANRQLLSHGD